MLGRQRLVTGLCGHHVGYHCESEYVHIPETYMPTTPARPLGATAGPDARALELARRRWWPCESKMTITERQESTSTPAVPGVQRLR